MIASSPADILRFLADAPGEGVLVTLTGIEGSSSRALGAQMAVRADGSWLGSFSGGCIEAAVAGEALDVLAAGKGRTVRFGSGSPYLDIRLPCGGGIDLQFTPRPDRAVLQSALALLDGRKPALLDIAPDSIALLDEGAAPSGQLLRLKPPLRIVALGQGEDLTAFVRLAARFGALLVPLCADRSSSDMLCAEGLSALHMERRTQLPDLASDPWTAWVFLFHDRDWEEFLLPQALAMPGFYHGAIGSPRTRAARLAALAAKGVDAAAIAALHGQIGLIPATRDPATLALSVLAEIVAAYNALQAPA